ncbi:PAS domain-containing protein [Alkalinema sp. FACHB-956]|uniref:PAS domain-containing protein n=1 Tax=Alkalinema sp. FACHB-956 TaxID=2692768 RepID=UPI0016860289|nr:PAS domain-containing protein [Alkalinema sp. FACHB-956]MBD2329970.1 PAS domain-containing protein [Alkalinema sp. FACHB-956]
MADLIKTLFASGSFIPHGHCYLWQTNLVGLHVLSDAMIALAYYSIPITLVYFVRQRKDLPFDWIFLLFGAFIISCGTTHLMEIWTLWHPAYWLSGMLKAVTALISLYTAIALVQLMPQALLLPSPAQLAEMNQELQQQIHDRQQAEAQVRQLNQVLEAKVAQRTADLEQSMNQVRESMQRATLAMDAAKMGSWEWDLATQTIIWSPYHERLWGYVPGMPERSYEDWARRVHPEDLARVESAIEQARGSDRDFSEEYRVVWDDGSMHWVAAFGRFYFDAQDEPFQMRGMVQDIDERKRTEAAFLESESRFRTLADNISQLAWMADANGWIFWYNRRWFEYTGTTLEQMQGWGWQQVHHPDHLDRVVERYRHCVVETGQTWEDTFPLRGQEGSYRWFLSRAIPITDEDGKILRWFGTNTDITDLKYVQDTLEERNKELDSFVHVVSHDLKAPLRAIANLSEWIEEDLDGKLEANTQQQMALLRSRVYRMEAMISGLLNYARVGRVNFELESVAVADLLLEVMDSLAIPTTFTVKIAPDFPTILTKRLLLFQVFANLIGNGIKHHDRPDGTIRLAVVDRKEFYEFVVADDGPGIAPEDQASIFTMFQTGSSQKKDSTGVGLAIVKKIIEAETGTIRVESQIGQGTTFYFTWPKQPRGPA